jgi:hypothetical protein
MPKVVSSIPTNSNLLSTSIKPTKFVAKQYERPGLSEDEIIEIK